MYLLKLALRPWRRAPVSQVFSGFAVGFLLALVGLLFWLQQGLRPVVARMQGEQVITAYVQTQLSGDESRKLGDAIRVRLGAAPSASASAGNTTEVEWVGVEEFLKKLKRGYPELARELEELGPELDALVPRHFSIAGLLPDEALTQIRALPGVESAESSRDRYRHIVDAFRALRWIARALAIGLCVALLTGLIHLSKMNAFLHRDALAILRSWGAARATLHVPGMFSGLAVGILGGAVAALLWVGFASPVSQGLRAFSPVLRQIPAPDAAWALLLLPLGALMGLMAGALGQLADGGGAER